MWMKEFFDAYNHFITTRDDRRRTEQIIRWHFPRIDWVKFNLDGSVRGNSSPGCGGVCKDEAEGWLIDFSKFLDITSVVRLNYGESTLVWS